MNKNNVVGLKGRDTITDALTEMLQSGAQELIQQAVQVELEELLQQYTARLTTEGNAAVVRNGYLPERKILTGIGPVTVRSPKVRAKSGEPVRFHSALVPPSIRKTQSIEAALPWLYLKGISTGEMEAALKVLVGDEALGLSASTVSRLKQEWGQQYQLTLCQCKTNETCGETNAKTKNLSGSINARYSA